ncbi:MAG: hypothetical protein U9P07_02760 [Pseudomonadota bacterium]|nr:hypothetical protein [Pseudomonadota bacterium]
MAFAHSRRPSMAGLWGALKQCPRVRRESHRVVIRSAVNTACLSADRLRAKPEHPANMSPAMQLRKLSN